MSEFPTQNSPEEQEFQKAYLSRLVSHEHMLKRSMIFLTSIF